MSDYPHVRGRPPSIAKYPLIAAVARLQAGGLILNIFSPCSKVSSGRHQILVTHPHSALRNPLSYEDWRAGDATYFTQMLYKPHALSAPFEGFILAFSVVVCHRHRRHSPPSPLLRQYSPSSPARHRHLSPPGRRPLSTSRGGSTLGLHARAWTELERGPPPPFLTSTIIMTVGRWDFPKVYKRRVYHSSRYKMFHFLHAPPNSPCRSPGFAAQRVLSAGLCQRSPSTSRAGTSLGRVPFTAEWPRTRFRSIVVPASLGSSRRSAWAYWSRWPILQSYGAGPFLLHCL